jgi:hypothetical protein
MGICEGTETGKDYDEGTHEGKGGNQPFKYSFFCRIGYTWLPCNAEFMLI